MSRARWAALPAMLAAVTASSASAGLPAPLLALTRLQGRFELGGRITDAWLVRGERRGQTFVRIWTFTPTCRSGPCPTIELVRARSGGTDRLTLRRTAPGQYRGTGRFYAPLGCGSRTYPHGESVPFTITVGITAVVPFAGTVYASRVDATYVNRSRANLTPCVAVPGHDAAELHGHAAPLKGPSPGPDPVTGGQSPAGS